ncbi:MAG: hypothetical protein C5B55_06310 [Blastocatellia bacterium]|nr:MAG: hypothetical protein C5B55_06310 [Blastocatellia bacterium]
MTTSLVYNIPAKLIETYRGHNLIVRSFSSFELANCFLRADITDIRFAQLLSVESDTSALEGSGEGIPLEIFLEDPEQYHQLYRFVNLLDSHPVRIAIPVVAGFSDAVKQASSLDFCVKLELFQPAESLIDELEFVLDLYLHRIYIRQPIDFFQTTLLSFYRDEPVSLWQIAEENPEQVRYITDEGEETISKRFVGARIEGEIGNFTERFSQKLISERRECHECEFFNRCNGYFKWPDRNYRCDGIKRIFHTLKRATQEVRQDLAAYDALEVQA